uniref:auxin-responsive protein IAA31-like n=1 Tax=Erigeron canadensis TaxID=72917 RepID=UPI001CB984C6|nr:auxin-responsive protein IAA31-like [Erigeron canadensis]
MDLQLALSLSSSSSSSSSCFTKFDLNKNNHDDNNNNNNNVHENKLFEYIKMQDYLNKRKLCVEGDHQEEEDGMHRLETLPLLFSNKSNNHEKEEEEEEDVNNEVQSTFIFINHKSTGEEENSVVGWPPVKSSRKKFCHQKNVIGDDGHHRCVKAMYVKVQMEGDGIARKIDLNLHHSYQTLVHTLAQMFGKCNEDVKLTYQDKEGDWLLAGDIPWGSFIESVQRLKLLKIH